MRHQPKLLRTAGMPLLALLGASGSLALLAEPAGAQVDVAAALAIADRWAAQQAPTRPNPCAGGNLHVTWAQDPQVEGQPVGGFAAGWTQNGAWDYTRCEVTIRSGLSQEDACWSIAHELMHYVVGPAHVGPLAFSAPGAIECYGDEPLPPSAAFRQKLVASIRRSLPAPRSQWQITCSTSPAKTRCVLISGHHVPAGRRARRDPKRRAAARETRADRLRSPQPPTSRTQEPAGALPRFAARDRAGISVREGMKDCSTQ